MASNTDKPPKPDNVLPPKAGRLELYSELLPVENKPTAVISSAPVIYTKDQLEEQERKKKEHAALSQLQKFHNSNIRRPQQQNKSKSRPGFAKGLPPQTSSSSPDHGSKDGQGKKPNKPTFADFAVIDDDDINGFYGGDGGPRNRKKNKRNKGEQDVPTDWGDMYDSKKPTNYKEYKYAQNRYDMQGAWKKYLHKQVNNISRIGKSGQMFAPPTTYDTNDSAATPSQNMDTPTAETGDDAYAQRLRMTQAFQQPPEPPSPQAEHVDVTDERTPPPPPPPPPQSRPGAFISAAPVFYDAPRPSHTSGEPGNEPISADRTNTNAESDGPAKPPTKRFGLKMLEKYGYKKGQGLGKDESGMLKALEHRIEPQKRPKKRPGPDSEGDSLGNRPVIARIIGGKRAKVDNDEGPYGAPSDVIVVWDLLDGVDLDLEEGIREKIGTEFGQKFGEVDRLVIHENSKNEQLVLVKFKAHFSALRAINAINELNYRFDGKGDQLRARYWPEDKFNSSVYE